MYLQKPPLGTQLDWNNHLNKGVVMHLAMNEGHGDKVQDLSMNRKHGTLNNFAFPSTAASGWNPGQTGIGLNFDGTDDYVNCGHADSLTPPESMTVSTLTKVDTYVAGEGLVVKGISGAITNPPYSLQLDTTGFRFLTVNAANNVAEILAPGHNDTNHWYALVGTFNSGKIHLYIDGNEIGTGSAQTDIGATTGDLMIGQQKAGIGRFVDANIDQVRIQSRAWSAKEVKDYYINPWQVYLDEDD